MIDTALPLHPLQRLGYVPTTVRGLILTTTLLLSLMLWTTPRAQAKTADISSAATSAIVRSEGEASAMDGKPATETEGQAPLQSPYFVDDVHCSGFTPMPKWTFAFWGSLRDELAAELNRASCLSLFSSFGIDRYSWHSPEDFANLERALRMTNDFSEVTLRLDKSELKNHIHAFLDVKVAADRTYVDLQTTYFSGAEQSEARLSTYAKIERSFNQIPRAKSSFGVEHFSSGTSGQYSLGVSPPLTGDEVTRFQNSGNYQRTHLYMNTRNDYMFAGWTSAMRLGLVNHNVTTSRQATTDGYLDLDLVKINHLGIIRTDFGLALSATSSRSYANDLDSSDQSSDLYAGLVFRSEHGRPESTYMLVGGRYLTSTRDSDQRIWGVNVDMRWAVESFRYVDQFYVRLDTKASVDSDHPLYRELMGTKRLSNTEVGLNKNLMVASAPVRLSAFFGSQSLEGPERNVSTLPADTRHFLNLRSDIGVRALTKVSDWDLNASLVYVDGRVY